MSFDPLKSRTPTNASTAMDSTSSTRPWWHLSRLWLVPAAVFLATFGVFGVRHPGSVKAMLSLEGIGVAVAATVCVAIAIWAAQFRPKIRPVLPFVVALGVLGAAFYAEVPFERRSTQNRTLVAEPIADAATATTVAPPVAASQPETQPGAAAMPTTAARPATAAAPPTATRRATGQLRGINHTASGDVSIVESSTGERVVRFADFDVQGSPEPVLYLIEGSNQTKPGGTKLGAFTATDGDVLDVALPAGVEAGSGWTALIWCEKFDTPIANASLS